MDAFRMLFCKSQSNFDSTYGGENVYYLNHARTGIYIALKALELPTPSKIGIIAYNCHTVMNVVSMLQHEIVFIDVTDQFQLDIDDLKKKSTNLSVLVVSHLFGISTDIQQIRKVVPNLVIIEDCAHSWWSEYSDGEKSGTKGDMAVFSSGLGKFPSIGDGGVLCVNNPSYISQINFIYNQLPTHSLIDNFKLVIKNLITSFLYSSWIYSWFTLPLKNKNRKIDVKQTETLRKMSSGVNRILKREYPYLKTYTQQQKGNADMWLRWLEKECFDIRILPKEVLMHSNCFMLPIYCNNDKNEVIQVLEKKGIEVRTHFDRAIEWATQFGYTKGTCPNTEKLIEHCIMLPCHYKLSPQKINKYLNK